VKREQKAKQGWRNLNYFRLKTQVENLVLFLDFQKPEVRQILKRIFLNTEQCYRKCTICVDVISVNEDVVITQCGHFFHNECPDGWWASSNCNKRCAFCNQTTEFIKL
jgi:hypothetical protein